MTPEALAAALLAQAEGSYSAEAAAGLLVAHRSWLARADFLRFVDVAPSFSNERVLMASINWEAALAANMGASSSETQMLAVAAELAGVHSGRSLRDLLGGLNRANTTLVIRAVLHAQRGASTPPLAVAPFPPVGHSADRDVRTPFSDIPSVDGQMEPEGPEL